MKMKVYPVGHNEPEHDFVANVHKTREGAFKAWNKIREELLSDAKKSLKHADKFSKEMYKRMAKNFSNKILQLLSKNSIRKP